MTMAMWHPGAKPLTKDNPDKAEIANKVPPPEASRLIQETSEPFEADAPHPGRRALAKSRDSIDRRADPLNRSYRQIAIVEDPSLLFWGAQSHDEKFGSGCDDSFSHLPA